MNWIRAHFQRYRERTPWAFCWRITLECLVVSIAAVIMLVIPEIFLDLPGRHLPLDDPFFFADCVTLTPIVETLVFQAFPVWIARKCKAGFSVQVLASLVPFTLAHTGADLGTAIGAGLVGGFYFAFTYAHWRAQSRWTAFWTTALSHALHNGTVLAIPAIVLLCGNGPSSTAEGPPVTIVEPASPASSEPNGSSPVVTSAGSPLLPPTPLVPLLPGGYSETPPSPSLPRPVPAQSAPGASNLPAIRPTPPPVAGRTYQIVKGDTLTGIAKKTGVSVKGIEDANPGTDPNKLKIGNKLQIPGKGANP